MDSKTIALSLLIAVIMGSSGAVVYTLNTTNADAEEEPVETTQDSKVENQPPKLMIDEEITRTWDGTNMFVEGYVYDEDLASTHVSVSVLNENFADLGEVVAVDPGPEAGASELSPDVVDAALEQIMPAIIGLGGKIEVISAEGDEVMLKYEGPPKIKFGIELALKDNPLIENVVFL